MDPTSPAPSPLASPTSAAVAAGSASPVAGPATVKPTINMMLQASMGPSVSAQHVRFAGISRLESVEELVTPPPKASSATNPDTCDTQKIDILMQETPDFTKPQRIPSTDDVDTKRWKYQHPTEPVPSEVSKAAALATKPSPLEPEPPQQEPPTEAALMINLSGRDCVS